MCKKTTMRHKHDAMALNILTILPAIASLNDPLQIEIYKNGLRGQLFDLGNIDTGYVSSAAIETGKPKNKLTAEHIYPRNRSAIQIINRVLSGKPISKKRLASWIKSRCRTHTTTGKENTALVELQKKPDYHWRKGYNEAGIILQQHKFPGKQKLVYFVDDIVYNSIHEVCAAYGISKPAARWRFRCHRPNTKFKGWRQHEQRIT